MSTSKHFLCASPHRPARGPSSPARAEIEPGDATSSIAQLPIDVLVQVASHLRARDVHSLEAALAAPGQLPVLWHSLAAPLRAALGPQSIPEMSFEDVMAQGLPADVLHRADAASGGQLEAIGMLLPKGCALQRQLVGGPAIARAFDAALGRCAEAYAQAQARETPAQQPPDALADAVADLQDLLELAAAALSADVDGTRLNRHHLALAPRVIATLSRLGGQVAPAALQPTSIDSALPLPDRQAIYLQAVQLFPTLIALHGQLEDVPVLCAAAVGLLTDAHPFLHSFGGSPARMQLLRRAEALRQASELRRVHTDVLHTAAGGALHEAAVCIGAWCVSNASVFAIDTGASLHVEMMVLRAKEAHVCAVRQRCAQILTRHQAAGVRASDDAG